MISKLNKKTQKAAKALEFEYAAHLRDMITQLESDIQNP
jgi:excinuclease UvrABC helicase subunit UvrB